MCADRNLIIRCESKKTKLLDATVSVPSNPNLASLHGAPPAVPSNPGGPYPTASRESTEFQGSHCPLVMPSRVDL